MSFGNKTTKVFIDELAAKQATPGGGAAAALAAAQACALAEMAANYTTGKKFSEHADAVQTFIDELQVARNQFIELADADAVAYADLQRSWRDKDMDDAEKQRIQTKALQIPSQAVVLATTIAQKTAAFLTICNPNIRSDAKAAIHLMAGAAHAAYHTAMVNKPNPAQTNDLQDALAHIRLAEQSALK